MLLYANSLVSLGVGVQPVPEAGGFYGRRLIQASNCKTTYVNISTSGTAKPFTNLTIVELAQFSERAGLQGETEDRRGLSSCSSKKLRGAFCDCCCNACSVRACNYCVQLLYNCIQHLRPWFVFNAVF